MSVGLFLRIYGAVALVFGFAMYFFTVPAVALMQNRHHPFVEWENNLMHNFAGALIGLGLIALLSSPNKTLVLAITVLSALGLYTELVYVVPTGIDPVGVGLHGFFVAFGLVALLTSSGSNKTRK